MLSSTRVVFLICCFGVVSGCKVGAFYAGTTELKECKNDVSKKAISEEFKNKLEQLGYSVDQASSNLFEIKSLENDEYGVKLVFQKERKILQVIGVDFPSQECGYNRDCPISDKGHKKMTDLLAKIGESMQCSMGKISISDIKKLESPSKEMKKWKEDESYLVE